MKLLVTVLVVALLLWLLFGRPRRGGASGGAPAPGAGRSAPLEGMVACAHCGVHLPASETLPAHGRHYCCAAHRDAGPAAPS